MQGTEFIVQIERNRALASAMELHGTPAFVIGDTILPGAVSIEEMKAQIAKARAGKGRPADKTESAK
jgi:protein-disulfide isomerase